MSKQVKAVHDHWPTLSQREFDELMSDFEAFCEKGSLIINKNSQAVPFALNEAQKLVARWILKEVFKPFPSPINVFIHKSRQMGVSVVIAKVEQFLATKLPNLNCQHIMPVEADADDLCDKKFIPLLEGTHPLLLPNITATKRRVKFVDMDGKSIKSYVDFTSAENRSGSRGQPLDDDTPVPTPNGFKRHGDIVKGDIVFDKYGNEVVVNAVYPQGVIDLYRVTLSDGSYLDAGLDHRWEVYKSGPTATVCTTKELIDRLNNNKRNYISKNKAVQYSAKTFTLDPYKLGLLLGDGRLDEEGRAFIYSADQEILNQFDGDCKLQPNGNKSKRKYCRGLIPIIRTLNLQGKRAWEKSIPDEYMFSSIEQRYAILAGLLDTDGSINNDKKGIKIELTTTSQKLAQQVKVLVKSLGGYCGVSIRDKRGDKSSNGIYARRLQYRVVIRTPQNPFRLKRKSDMWRECTRGDKLIVKSIKKVSTKSAQCLSVDSESHTYLAGYDFMVTHNTNQVVIEDEYAHYGNPTYLDRGVLATMPRTGRSVRVVVSTAYGMNHFYDLSKTAQTSEYWKYYFLPWHMLSEYEREPTGRLKDLTALTPYEVKLCEIFEAEGYPVKTWPRKMAWYEYTLETEAKMDYDYMYENYPSTADESFAATGAPVLPANKIREFREAQRPFEYVEMIQDASGKTSIVKTNLSTMKRFVEPIRGRKYIIGADPADGGEQGDFSAAAVIDLTTMEDVFCIKEKLDQNDFAELLSHLGRYYNNAQIVPERNTGQSLIEWLVMLKYPNIYVNPVHTTKYKVSYGIYMTPMVKKDAITRLKFLINNGIYKSYDPDFIEEALHFVWKKTPSGKQKAIGGEGHGDDVVMSRVIAAAALNMNRYKNYESSQEHI